MKVALISPCKEEQRWRGQKSRFVWPPMGLLTLGALTPSDVDLRLHDEAVDPFDPETVEADLAAISILTASAPRGYAVADALRRRGIPVIIGGIHAWAMPEEAAEHADAVFIGEAEMGWQEALEDARSGRGLRPLYRAEGNCDPALIPAPRRSLLKPGAYGVPATVMATRGCPYNCSFCSTTAFMGNRYRLRPVSHVVEDLASIPHRWCIFLDDNLFARRAYAADLMEAIRPLGKRWVAQTTMNAATDGALLRLAYGAGCRGVLIGFESLSEANLKDVRKGVNRVDAYRDVVDRFHEAGIFVQGSFIFGFDNDPPDPFSPTLDFVEKARLEAANYSILTPLPGTDLYRTLLEENRITEGDWSRFDKLNVCFRPRGFDPDDLVGRVKKIYRDTYSLRSIFRRVPLFRRSTPIALAYNLTYRRGVYKNWD